VKETTTKEILIKDHWRKNHQIDVNAIIAEYNKA